MCPIDESVHSDSLCHLSEIALHFNRKLVWDPQKEHFLGDEEANLRLLSRKMREPWSCSKRTAARLVLTTSQSMRHSKRCNPTLA